MSYQNQGQSSGDEFKPSGNRPAQNARQSTPSALSQSHFTGEGEAADFLGLGDEVGALGASGMMAPGPAQAPAPALGDYEDDELYEDAAGALDESEDDLDSDYEDDFDDEDDDGVHSSWVDEAPSGGKRMLPKVGVAVVLGMAATAGFFAMQQGDGVEVAGVSPLAPEMNTTPTYQERMFDRSEEPAPRVEVASLEPEVEGSEPEPPKGVPADPVASKGGTPASSLVAPADGTPLPELAGVETTAGEDQVRQAGETVAGLVPTWRAGQTPPPGGGFEDSGDEQGSALTVVGDETGAPGVDEHAYWDEIDETVAEEVGGGGRGKFLGWDEPLTGSLTAAPLGFDGEADEQAAGEPLDHVVERLSGWEDDDEPAPEDFADDDFADDELAAADADTDESFADELAGGPDPVDAWTEPVALAGSDDAGEAEDAPVAAPVSESWSDPVSDTPVQPLVVGGERVAALVTERAEEPAEEVAKEVDEVEAQPLDQTAGTGPVAQAVAQAEDPGTAAETPQVPTGPETSSAQGGEDEQGPGAFGPSLPAGVAPTPVASTTGTGSSTTRVRVMQTSDVLEQGSKGPRPATAEEMKGVWLQPEVPPMHAITQKHKVLTPQVGQVRVIQKDGEIFQGRLYAMGEGRVWVTSDSFGQMGLDGSKVDRIQRMVAGDKSDESTAGVDSLDQMETVRVKTPGGILVGKVINRDAHQTTIVTDDGARVTLASKQVEILDQNPGVTLKRAAPVPSEDGDGGQP